MGGIYKIQDKLVQLLLYSWHLGLHGNLAVKQGHSIVLHFLVHLQVTVTGELSSCMDINFSANSSFSTTTSFFSAMAAFSMSSILNGLVGLIACLGKSKIN